MQPATIGAINGKEVIQLDDDGRSYEKVGLRPVEGTSKISRFSLTGHVARPQHEGAK